MVDDTETITFSNINSSKFQQFLNFTELNIKNVEFSGRIFRAGWYSFH